MSLSKDQLQKLEVIRDQAENGVSRPQQHLVNALNVILDPVEGKQKDDEFDPGSVDYTETKSTDLTAKESVAVIGVLNEDEAAEFVPDSEDRVTVRKALKEKLS